MSEPLRAAVLDALESRWWGYGPRCHALEQAFTARWGGRALATSSCTAALYLCALELRKRGHEVIVPAITFVSTAMAFAHAGLRVVLADVDERLMLTERTVAPLLSEKTAAVVAVHLYGQRCDVDELWDLCSRRRVALIEDRAHRVGLDDAPRGDVACLSFNAVKEIPVGEGGMLWCRDDAVADSAGRSSYLGMDVDTWSRSRQARHVDYVFSPSTGLKLRMTDIDAALALAGLSALPSRTERRQHIYARYEKVCGGGASPVTLPARTPADSLLMSVARVPSAARESIRQALARRGVATSVHYPSLASHELFTSDRCPVAAQASEQLVTLPSSADLSEDEVDAVVEALRSLSSGTSA